MVSRAKAGKIPALSPGTVHRYLTEIGENWTGKGYAIELGSWFGATAVPLLVGLKRAGYDLDFYSWDRWKANKEQIARAKKYGVKLRVGENIQPYFLKNVSIHDKVIACRGQILENLNWIGEPIEICLFDAPKLPEVFVPCVKHFAAHWIPGVTIVGLLDFYFYRRHGEPKREKLRVARRFVDHFRESFTLLAQWPEKCSCAFFRYEGGEVWTETEKWK